MTHDPRRCYPVPPQCTYGRSGSYENPCAGAATHLLYTPERHPAAGGEVCETHGASIVAEFREKIQEVWTIEPIHRYDYMTCSQEDIANASQ